MRMLRFFVLFFVISGISEALTSVKHSCRIEIQATKKNGEIERHQFSSPMKSKEQCQTLAQFHRKNFNSDLIQSKKVSYFWKKSKKTIPILAKANRKTPKNKNKTARRSSL